MGFKIPKGIEKVPMTVRVEENDFNIIENLAKKNNKSMNDIVCAMIKYAIENMEEE